MKSNGTKKIRRILVYLLAICIMIDSSIFTYASETDNVVSGNDIVLDGSEYCGGESENTVSENNIVLDGEEQYAVETENTVLDEEENQGSICISGTFYDMGYEFSKLDLLTDNISVTVKNSDGIVVATTSSTNGTYSFALEKGGIYSINYAGYIHGRMAKMNVNLNMSLYEDRELNLAVRTNNVAGMAEQNKYEIPPNCFIIRKLTEYAVDNESFRFNQTAYNLNFQ